MDGKEPSTYKCSFCDQSASQVQKLIAGPRGVYICDECIRLCVEILKAKNINVVADTERDNFMTTQDAKEYGLIDDVVSRPINSDEDNN